jgi:hypothetical protein
MSYKSSTGRNIGKLLNVFQSGKTILGQGIGGGGSAAAVFSATGGTLVQSGGYNYHVFTQPDIFSVTNTTGVGVTITSLVVGGGGGMGGGDFGRFGSGGAGGVVQFTYVVANSSSMPVTVGSGGGTGSNGNSSVLNTTSVIGSAVTALGGGAGGGGFVFENPSGILGAAGGSGGGGGASAFPNLINGAGGAAQTATIPLITTSVGVATYRQGNRGGDGSSPAGGGSGGGSGGAGGGADSPGAAAPFSNFPGPVISPAIPAPVRPSWTPFVGPTGLFGQGGPTPGAIDFTGTGGGISPPSPAPTRTGASGIVIIRYLTP